MTDDCHAFLTFPIILVKPVPIEPWFSNLIYIISVLRDYIRNELVIQGLPRISMKNIGTFVR